ncbi:MAG: tRNA preQ1(34) S-adenosylmethionine ribosyltransferase-isomerase QueA [Desulfuromonadales bacterium]|nr:tRNA preQ1(34) S-adenosylmethionine ribosyltransferase-isomerase QueA [Desulfuromonadales bacterium]
MRLADFDFVLPEALIAQQPAKERSASRLLHLDRAGRKIAHQQFDQLPQLLREGDLLVRNETRVIPARLLGHKESGGRVEVLLVRQIDAATQTWRCLSKSSKALQVGTQVIFAPDFRGEIVAVEEGGERLVRFFCDGDFAQRLEQVGHMPLPPYIKREDAEQDRERYQTVFARNPGAIAAPTAGLHFTDEMFARLEQRNIEICGVTLHVGPGTFQPVRVENLSDHRMHSEFYEVSKETADRINTARAQGRRIVALGTTVTRTLEAAVDAEGRLQAGSGETNLFITPGFQFRAVDALFTNFHLPKSTLLVLVSAFAGREFVLKAYDEAVANLYRFFSYGDCMLIE